MCQVPSANHRLVDACRVSRRFHTARIQSPRHTPNRNRHPELHIINTATHTPARASPLPTSSKTPQQSPKKKNATNERQKKQHCRDCPAVALQAPLTSLPTALPPSLHSETSHIAPHVYSTKQNKATKRRDQLGVLASERPQLGADVVVARPRGHVPHARLASAALKLTPCPHATDPNEASYSDYS